MLGVHIGTEAQSYLDTNNHSTVISVYRHNLHINAFQLFIMEDYHKLNVSNETFRAYAQNGVHLYAHASYKTSIMGTTAKLMKAQYKLCSEQEFRGLVCHLIKRTPIENFNAIVELVKYSNTFSRIPHTKFLFEINGVKTDNKIVGISNTFETPDKINYIIDALIAAGITPNHMGFCLDTSHIWTGGINIRNSKEVRDWLSKIRDPKWIQLIHLNDSNSELGGRDLHTWVGMGKIWPIVLTASIQDIHSQELQLHTLPLWNEDPSKSQITLDNEWGFIEILRWAKKNNVDTILERKGAITTTHLSEIKSLRLLWDNLD
jgi:endonuclease IV